MLERPDTQEALGLNRTDNYPQVLRVVSREQRHRLLGSIESLMNGTSIPKGLKAVDDATRALTRPVFTWNLVVLRAPDAQT